MLTERKHIATIIYISSLLMALGSGVVFSQTPDAATKFRLAQGLEQAGDFERAAALYAELLTTDPSNYVYFDGLQRMFMQLKRYDDAIAIIQKRLSITPADINLRAMLGSVYYKAGREKEANLEWDRSIAADPANPRQYRIIANVVLENRLLDKAADIYRRGRVACGDPNLFTIELAQLLAASMDYAGATLEFIRWLEQNPTQMGFVQSRMAAFTWKPDGRNGAIEAVRTGLRKKEDVHVYELLGWLYLEGKEFNEAFEVYKTIDRISHSHGQGIYAFAERAFKERAFDLAAKAYLEAINTPVPAAKLPYAKYGYASSLKELSVLSDTLHGSLNAGYVPATESRPHYGGAVAYFKRIIEEYPRSEFSAKSYYQIGMIQFEKYFDLDGALASFERVRQEVSVTNTIRHEVSVKMGEVYTAKGDTTHAAAQFRSVFSARDATPDQTDEAGYRLAELDYFNGKFQDAIQRLSAITLNLKADYANDALQLQSFLQENTATAPPALTQFARADLLARQRKNTEAIPIFLKLIDQYPQAPLVDDALMKVAALQADAGLFAEAIASYIRLLVQFTESSSALDRAQFNLGEIYQYGMKDSGKAIVAYEKLLADYPKSLLTTQARKRIRLLRGDTF